MSRVKKTAAKQVKKVSPAKKAAEKKTTAKKIAKKTVRKTVAAKPPSARSEKIRLAAKRKAAVAARTKTLETTQVRVGDIGVVVIDDNDIVAKRKLAKIRRTAVDRIDDPPTATGVALVERVTRAVERELLQIETIVGGHRVKPQLRTEAERRARTLASLARTLSEVRRLRAADELQRGADGSSAGASRGPSAARDLDAFRRILSRRLEGVVARTTALPSAGDERGGDG